MDTLPLHDSSNISHWSPRISPSSGSIPIFDSFSSLFNHKKNPTSAKSQVLSSTNNNQLGQTPLNHHISWQKTPVIKHANFHKSTFVRWKLRIKNPHFFAGFSDLFPWISSGFPIFLHHFSNDFPIFSCDFPYDFPIYFRFSLYFHSIFPWKAHFSGGFPAGNLLQATSSQRRGRRWSWRSGFQATQQAPGGAPPEKLW